MNALYVFVETDLDLDLDLDVESRWQHGFDRAAKPQMGHHASCWALHSQLGQGVGLQSTLEDSSGA